MLYLLLKFSIATDNIIIQSNYSNVNERNTAITNSFYQQKQFYTTNQKANVELSN